MSATLPVPLQTNNIKVQERQAKYIFRSNLWLPSVSAVVIQFLCISLLVKVTFVLSIRSVFASVLYSLSIPGDWNTVVVICAPVPKHYITDGL